MLNGVKYYSLFGLPTPRVIVQALMTIYEDLQTPKAMFDIYKVDQ